MLPSTDFTTYINIQHCDNQPSSTLLFFVCLFSTSNHSRFYFNTPVPSCTKAQLGRIERCPVYNEVRVKISCKRYFEGSVCRYCNLSITINKRKKKGNNYESLESLTTLFSIINSSIHLHTSLLPGATLFYLNLQQQHQRAILLLGLSIEDSMVNKDNTSKLANMWETKLISNEEKGVRKSKAVDTPDEIVVSKPALASTTSSADSSPTTVTVLKTSSKPLPPLAPPNLSPNNSTRGIVQSKCHLTIVSSEVNEIETLFNDNPNHNFAH